MDLKVKPFNLNDEQERWVNETLATMSLDDKIKQLFVDIAAPVNEEITKHIVEEKKFGGIRYMNRSPKEVLDLITWNQKYSRIPLLVAANTEAGGNGACKGGTTIGFETKVAATGNSKYAYEMGRISALEAKAVGCNTLFAPIVDIHKNWRSPIIATRTWGNNHENVIKYSKEYLKAAHEVGVGCFVKHFPGDGIDERDQHLANSINPLSTSEWDKTYGKVYKEMIDAGVEGIMAGHIMLPSYEKHFNKDLNGADFMPATLSKYLLKNLLREKLGFNGVIITDASHMLGMTGRMKRSQLVPQAIASGCDMFLFYNDYQEDFGYVKDALNAGTLTKERIDEAVTRILAYKAHLNLYKNSFEPDYQALSVVGCEEHKKISDEVAQKAITLVKSNEKGVLPLSLKKYKKILLMHHDITTPFNSFISNGGGTKYYEIVKEALEKEGFDVELYTPVLEQLKNASVEETQQIMNKLYTSKSPVSSITNKYDLVIHLANVPGNGVVQRIDFALVKGGIDIPWYSHELPVIFISVNSPFHLFDVPNVQTYINCYDANQNTMTALVDKLVGKNDFTGVSPVDAFCASEDTRW